VPPEAVDHNAKVPGQLPAASEVMQSDYASMKQRAQENLQPWLGKK
jgi:hypothetical protein